jgi:hypothetical protein
VQSERFRKLKSRWHRDELGAERKAARRKCSKELAPILDIIRKYAVHASLKAVDALRECPMTLRLRYLTLKLRALCWVLRRLRAGRRGWLARPGTISLTSTPIKLAERV